jgi:hypothetical protein
MTVYCKKPNKNYILIFEKWAFNIAIDYTFFTVFLLKLVMISNFFNKNLRKFIFDFNVILLYKNTE